MTNCLSIDTLTSFSWNSMIYLSEESIIQISFRKNTLEKMAERLSVFQVPVGLSILTQAKQNMVVIVNRRVTLFPMEYGKNTREGRAPHGKNKWP